ncbi:hypothetical protein GS444_12105 [Rhodococcus hoagii]|nr:hypothetical protein [Prescottella equi]
MTVPQTAETNQQVTLTANLDPTNASGTVQFKDNGTNIGSAVAVADGAPPCSTLSRRPETQHHGSFRRQRRLLELLGGGAIRHRDHPVVPDAPTTTTLTVPATTVKGTATTLTATVTPANASGSVQFLDGQTPIGGPATVTKRNRFRAALVRDVR